MNEVIQTSTAPIAGRRSRDLSWEALINSKGLSHPSGVLPDLLQGPGVSLRSTPGYVSLNPSGSINQWFPDGLGVSN
jgi:hypothetical protein